MKTIARILDGRVVETIRTAHDPNTLFHPALDWRPVPDGLAEQVCVNWLFSGSIFSPPSPLPDAEPRMTVQELQAQIERLSAAAAALATRE